MKFLWNYEMKKYEKGEMTQWNQIKEYYWKVARMSLR